MNRRECNNHFYHYAAVVATAFAVTACGGGASGDSPGATASANAATPSGTASRGASDSASASVSLATQAASAADQNSVVWIAQSGQNVSASAGASVSIGQGQPTSYATSSTQGMPSVIQQGFRPGQSFIMQRDGWISGAEIYIKSCRGANPAPDLKFEIRKGSDISATVVATGIVSASSIPPQAGGACAQVPATMIFVTPSQEGALAVKTGEVYSIWPAIWPAESGGEAFQWASSNGYAQGTFWKRTTSGELDADSAIEVTIKTFTLSPSS